MNWHNYSFYAFPPFSLIWNMPSEDSTGPGNRRSNSPPLASPTLVSSSPLSTYGQPSDSTMFQNPPDTVSQRCTSPLEEPAAANSLQTLRRTFEQRGISSQAADIIIRSWTCGTQKQYQPYIKKWLEFCHGRENNPYDPPIATVWLFGESSWEGTRIFNPEHC